jgi:hypothetical protein
LAQAQLTALAPYRARMPTIFRKTAMFFRFLS